MSRYFILLILSILVFNNTYSQKIDLLIKSLKSNQLIEFIESGNHITVNDSNSLFRMNFSKDLMSKYKSYKFIFHEARNDKKKHKKYGIRLVTDENKIIYSEVSNHISKYAKKNLYQYFDKKSILKFDSVYTLMFGDTSQLEMLFKTEETVGCGCGFGGGYASSNCYEYKLAIDKNDTKILRMWINSHLATYQVWGLMGFNKLIKKGYKLMPNEKKSILRLLKVKTVVNICSGCMYDAEEVSNYVPRELLTK